MSTSEHTIPVAVLGGTGYVAGELLRLLAQHPRLRVVSVVSTSQAGEPLIRALPHLAGAGLDDLRCTGANPRPSPLSSRSEDEGGQGGEEPVQARGTS